MVRMVLPNDPASVRVVRAGGWVAGTLLFVLLVLAGAPREAAAGSVERMGTNGAPELLISVGPRSNALGGNAVADVTGSEALFWNPAGLAVLGGTEVVISHINHIGETDVNFFSLSTKAGSIGNIGFFAKVFNVGDVTVTTETAPDGTGEILSPTFATLGASYARQFTDRVRFGATAMFINESIAQANAKGVAFDFGFQYDLGAGGPVFGFAMKNFGPAIQYDGPSLDVATPPPGSEPGSSNRILGFSLSENELPSYFQLGAAYDIWSKNNNRLRVLGTFTSNNFTPDDLRAGAEYQMRDLLALRVGYNSFVSNTDRDVYDGFSFGAGVGVPIGEARVQVEYAHRMVQNFFDDTQEFGLRVMF